MFIITKLILVKLLQIVKIFNLYVSLFLIFCPKMSQSDSQKSFDQPSSDTQSEQYTPKASKSVKKSKQTTKSLQKNQKQKDKQIPKKRGPKKKQQKVKQQKKEAGKRKPKSKKQAKKQGSDNKAIVLEYMQKQNRPYNLLNIFDNLHGKIKKSELQIILNQLTEQQQFSCKQFGKNKVYYLNQQKFDLDMKEVEQISSTYTRLKEQQKQLRDINKNLTDDYRKLMAKKTFQQLEVQFYSLHNDINKLKKKKQYLVGEDIQKVDEQKVIQIEKQSIFLQKQLKKRKKLTKQCLDTWSEMTEKKVPQLAEMMGIQLQ